MSPSEKLTQPYQSPIYRSQCPGPIFEAVHDLVLEVLCVTRPCVKPGIICGICPADLFLAAAKSWSANPSVLRTSASTIVPRRRDTCIFPSGSHETAGHSQGEVDHSLGQEERPYETS